MKIGCFVYWLLNVDRFDLLFVYDIDELFLFNILGNLEECVRYRGGMGRLSGGVFDGGVVFVYSLSGRVEFFVLDVCD